MLLHLATSPRPIPWLSCGIPPAPERQNTTWPDFLRSQADALLACDPSETRALTGAHLYAFAVIEHATRRHRA
ncbi:hypothetical protein ACH4VM_37775 [Streptomyces sp. NPDC020792]|uniref:hypothetical protein n=1 Tax=Streptomyces sp. NPDC020792 TaxID=3365089 RepID=UPI0037B4EDB8